MVRGTWVFQLSRYTRGTLSEQPADLQSLETALLRAREIAEEFDEALILYFIDMAIAETRMKKSSDRNRSQTSPP